MVTIVAEQFGRPMMLEFGSLNKALEAWDAGSDETLFDGLRMHEIVTPSGIMCLDEVEDALWVWRRLMRRQFWNQDNH